jgi:alkyl sulfatase BDS1-like metallo-beta-lactamase superfamily hydrolase
MQILMKRMKRIEIAEKIDEALWNWYFERGMEVPNWKMQKDPQWWVDYLTSLDENT